MVFWGLSDMVYSEYSLSKEADVFKTVEIIILKSVLWMRFPTSKEVAFRQEEWVCSPGFFVFSLHRSIA